MSSPHRNSCSPNALACPERKILRSCPDAPSFDIYIMEKPKQDVQTVTPEGEPVQRVIEGVKIIRAVTDPDERGTLCEILSLALKAHPAAIVYVYQFTIRPGKVQCWHIHHLHDDRIFISQVRSRLFSMTTAPGRPLIR